MKELVTGGAGFIGSNFVRYWRKHHPEDHIVVLDKFTYAGHRENLRGLDIELIEGDICDPKAIAQAMLSVDMVVHFAAESHVDRSLLNPADFVKTNVLGTQVLVEAALENGVKRFHHVSTDEVFGALPLESQHKFNE